MVKKKLNSGIEELTLLVSDLSVLVEDVGSIPSIHVAAKDQSSVTTVPGVSGILSCFPLMFTNYACNI